MDQDEGQSLPGRGARALPGLPLPQRERRALRRAAARCSPLSATARRAPRTRRRAARAPARLRALPGGDARLPGGARGVAGALAPAPLAARSLLDRAHDTLGGLHSRLPGRGGAAAESAVTQVASTGGARGAGHWRGSPSCWRSAPEPRAARRPASAPAVVPAPARPRRRTARSSRASTGSAACGARPRPTETTEPRRPHREPGCRTRARARRRSRAGSRAAGRSAPVEAGAVEYAPPPAPAPAPPRSPPRRRVGRQRRRGVRPVSGDPRRLLAAILSPRCSGPGRRRGRGPPPPERPRGGRRRPLADRTRLRRSPGRTRRPAARPSPPSTTWSATKAERSSRAAERTGPGRARSTGSRPGRAGTYTLEVWLEDANGAEGPPAIDHRCASTTPGPASVEPLRPPGWIGRAELPLASASRHPPGPPPPAGIRGYAISVDRDPEGEPCAATARCSDDETDLRDGIDDDTLVVGDLPEGLSYVHAVAVSGSGMRSAATGTAPLRVDRTTPSPRLAGVPDGWVDRPVELRATATDAASGMRADGAGRRPSPRSASTTGRPRRPAGAGARATVIGSGRPHGRLLRTRRCRQRRRRRDRQRAARTPRPSPRDRADRPRAAGGGLPAAPPTPTTRS